MSSDELIERVSDRDRVALARLITMLESGDSAARAAVDRLDPSTGAKRIGVTGPPGAGKSTLVSAMIEELRARGLTVAVLAVDPSSPITGGALLGDRIRMQDHIEDPGVFIRSMASRGHLGGLAVAAGAIIGLLAHAGFDQVLVETVGVGQSEVEVMDHVDLVVLVVAPGWGDQIQIEKAGVLEIADVVVVNKGDIPGADSLRQTLLASKPEQQMVLATTAATGEGVGELVESILGEISPRSPG